MPNYEQIVKESQENVKSLSEKLKDLDQLYQDINSLKTKPESILLAFNENFQEISELFKQYIQTLGIASKMYLDGSNSLFTGKIEELADKNAKLEKEISRLVNTDLAKLFADLQQIFITKTSEDLGVELKRFENNSIDFQDKIYTLKAQISRLISTDFEALFKKLQKAFIEQTQKDVAVELGKMSEKTTDFQTKIDSFGGEINRLEKVDLEKHFDKLQKTLSDIFGAINTINLTLIGLITSLNLVLQTLGQVQKAIEYNSEETNKLINALSKETDNHLNQQDIKNNTDFEYLKQEIANLSKQNIAVNKEIKTNKITQIIGFVVIISLLLYVIIKH